MQTNSIGLQGIFLIVSLPINEQKKTQLFAPLKAFVEHTKKEWSEENND